MAVSSQYGAFVPTNFVWEMQQIQALEGIDPQFKEILVRLYQNIGNISLVLNVKDTGYYPLQEFVNGQLYFPNPNNTSQTAAAPLERQVLRTTLNVGALPNTGTITIPHNITCTTATTFTQIYAAASDTTGKNYIPIPYASPTLANNIEIRADGTNVYITTGSNRTNFNVCYVVLEYMQS